MSCLSFTAECKVRLEGFNDRLDEHTEQDASQFAALREKLEAVDDKTDAVKTDVAVMAAKHDLVAEIGRKSGRASAAKVAPVITAIVLGAWEATKHFFGGGN